MSEAYHLEQLARLCAEHPTANKLVLVPSRQVGYNILTSLTRSGVQWVNLEAMSISDFAEQVKGPALRSSGLQ